MSENQKISRSERSVKRPGALLQMPGAGVVDHVGFVVPSLEQAVRFFCDIFGAAVLWESAPFSASGNQPKAPPGINVDPDAAFQLAMLRFGPNLNLELIEYRVPGSQRRMPSNSDLSVGHLAISVEDIHIAGAYLRRNGVSMLEGPRHNAIGPNAGQDSWMLSTPWGLTLELVQRPAHMPYEEGSQARLFE